MQIHPAFHIYQLQIHTTKNHNCLGLLIISIRLDLQKKNVRAAMECVYIWYLQGIFFPNRGNGDAETLLGCPVVCSDDY